MESLLTDRGSANGEQSSDYLMNCLKRHSEPLIGSIWGPVSSSRICETYSVAYHQTLCRPAPASTCRWRRRRREKARRAGRRRAARTRSWRRATWPWPSRRTAAWWTPPSRRTSPSTGSPWRRAAGTGASGRSSPWGTSSNRPRRRPRRSRERYDADELLVSLLMGTQYPKARYRFSPCLYHWWEEPTGCSR